MRQEEQSTVDLAHRRKSTEIFLDFQWKSITQTVDVITKGIGFYFVVLLGIVGTIHQSKINGQELLLTIIIATLITIAVCIACGFLTWGVVSGLHDIQDTLRSLNPEVFDERRLPTYFRRARIVARAVMIACFAISLVIIGALLTLRYR